MAAVGGENIVVLSAEACLEQLNVDEQIVDYKYAGRHLNSPTRYKNSVQFASPMNRRTVSRNMLTEMGLDT